jgi:hypothetical protein
VNVICAGSCLLLAEPAEPPLNKPHLWFVLTDPSGNPPSVVAVMMRTVTRFTDSTVILQPGDHPFIKHDLAIQYSNAQRFNVERLTRAMHSGRCHLRDTMSPELLDRVRRGLLESLYTVHAVRDYCKSKFAL